VSSGILIAIVSYDSLKRTGFETTEIIEPFLVRCDAACGVDGIFLFLVRSLSVAMGSSFDSSGGVEDEPFYEKDAGKKGDHAGNVSSGDQVAGEAADGDQAVDHVQSSAIVWGEQPKGDLAWFER